MRLPLQQEGTMSLTPYTLNLYKKNGLLRELRQSILPWGILELAVDMQEEFEAIELDAEGKVTNVSREQIQKLTDFVVYIFDDDVTVEELNRGASIEDMFALYQQIFTSVSKIMAKNPTIGQAVNRRKNAKTSAP